MTDPELAELLRPYVNELMQILYAALGPEGIERIKRAAAAGGRPATDPGRPAAGQAGRP